MLKIVLILSVAIATVSAGSHSECDVANLVHRGIEYKVRACKSDRRAASDVCLVTTVHPCCSFDISIGNFIGDAIGLSVGGEIGSVRFFLTQNDSVCYRLNTEFLLAESCLSAIGCNLLDCTRVTISCFNNSLNGSDSCFEGFCECKSGYLFPDCCDCDYDNNFYRTNNGRCLPYCSTHCAVRTPTQGCSSCEVGYIDVPECCECDIDNGYFRDDDGTCRQRQQFCSKNCEGDYDFHDGCVTCKPGYVSPPECCNCDINHFMTEDGTCEAYCPEHCFSDDTTHGCLACDDGYITAPYCCDCDIFNGYYITENETCEPLGPICAKNCLQVSQGEILLCLSCKPGYTHLPGCCDCDIENGYYRHENGTCIPLPMVCTDNCEGPHSIYGCDSCKPGYSPASECCECEFDNGYYMDIFGHCNPFCPEHCLGPHHKFGCIACETGYISVPKCCDCDFFNGYYKHDDGTCQPSEPICYKNCLGQSTTLGCLACKPGYTNPPRCCDCDIENGYYKHKDGTCQPIGPICDYNCLTYAKYGCQTCVYGYFHPPHCCDCDENHYMDPFGICRPLCSEHCVSKDSLTGRCLACKPGYIEPPHCCDCDVRLFYYRDNDGSCINNCCNDTGIEACTRADIAVCYCKTGYEGIGCCNCTLGFARNATGECSKLTVVTPLPIECDNGDIRLVGGSVPNEGRLEVCYNQRWGTVCAELPWSIETAQFICISLGYPSDGATANGLASMFGPGTGSVWLYGVDCPSNSTSNSLLDDCTYIVSPEGTACPHIFDVGVQCFLEFEDCNEGDLRLVNGTYFDEGRVEICHNRIWGTICTDSFELDKDGSVICRQLGFANEAATIYDFGEGTGPIWLDQLDCIGVESNLLDCPHSPPGISTCDHTKDLGIICTPLVLPQSTRSLEERIKTAVEKVVKHFTE